MLELMYCIKYYWYFINVLSYHNLLHPLVNKYGIFLYSIKEVLAGIFVLRVPAIGRPPLGQKTGPISMIKSCSMLIWSSNFYHPKYNGLGLAILTSMHSISPMPV